MSDEEQNIIKPEKNTQEEEQKKAEEDKAKEEQKKKVLEKLRKEYPTIPEEQLKCYFCSKRTNIICPYFEGKLTYKDISNHICENYNQD